MPHEVELSTSGIIAAYCLLIPVLLLVWFYHLRLTKYLIEAVVRMSLQLFLVGLYLRYIFMWNSLLVNLSWVMLMIIVAGWTVTRQIKLSFWKIFPAVLISLSFGLLAVLFYFVVLVIGKPPALAAVFIPVGGMLLGNSMRGNVIVIQRFEQSVTDNIEEYRLRLMLGATQSEALAPFEIDAFRSSLTPQIATMATIGIVSLPGMMTGQMLGGSEPMTAIQYQAAIMVGIMCAQVLSSVTLLRMLRKKIIAPSMTLL